MMGLKSASDGVSSYDRRTSRVAGLISITRFRQRSPEPIKARVEHFQNAAEIRRVGPIEEQITCGRIRVMTVRSLEQAEGDQGVEEMDGTTAMQSPSGRGASPHRPARSVNVPSSTALSSVFDAQNPEPSLHDVVGSDALQDCFGRACCRGHHRWFRLPGMAPPYAHVLRHRVPQVGTSPGISTRLCQVTRPYEVADSSGSKL